MSQDAVSYKDHSQCTLGSLWCVKDTTKGKGSRLEATGGKASPEPSPSHCQKVGPSSWGSCIPPRGPEAEKGENPQENGQWGLVFKKRIPAPLWRTEVSAPRALFGTQQVLLKH